MAQINVDNINRVEVIDSDGRVFCQRNLDSVDIQIQDGGTTMKIFIS